MAAQEGCLAFLTLHSKTGTRADGAMVILAMAVASWMVSLVVGLGIPGPVVWY